MTDSELTHGPAPLVRLRLALALGQALALHLLALAHAGGTWPATSPGFFAALFMAAVFAPLAVLQAAALPPRRLVAWGLTVAVAALAVGAHGVLREAPDVISRTQEIVERLPSRPTLVFFTAGLFIAQALVAAAHADRRLVASYATYFDIAWKQGVQAAASAGFCLAFWIVLALGGELFKLIKLDFLSRLIEHAWFAIPVTALVFAAAVHVTDVRPQIIRSIKTLALSLLSWLLPVAVLIAAGFLASLPFTGLEPLWATKSASAILLGFAGGLIILLNAAYQDGTANPPVLLRAAGTATAVLILPLVAIAAYALSLRVGQYGWSPDRVIAGACIVVGACYAAGYLLAAARWRPWLRPLEACNLLASLLVIVVLAAMLTPIADPARIAVANQVARLKSGAATPQQFDFAALRFQGGRYGAEALAALLRDPSVPQADFTRAEIARVQAAKGSYAFTGPAVDPAELAHKLAVIPSGRTLPEAFLRQDWSANSAAQSFLSGCAARGCTALLADLNGDGADEILVLEEQAPLDLAPRIRVFAASDAGWRLVGYLQHSTKCADPLPALRAGAFAAIPPAYQGLSVGDVRLPFVSTETVCP